MCQRLIHHHPIEFNCICQKHLKRKFPKHQPKYQTESGRQNKTQINTILQLYEENE